MNTAIHSQGAAASSRFMQLAMAGLLGVFMIGAVGFSHLEIAHNAAHDSRHALAFPCH